MSAAGRLTIGRLAVAAAAVAALGAASRAAGAGAEEARPEIASLFPRRAQILADGPGLWRLPLPPEVLAECRADLSDLRIVDAAGREVPYLIDAGLAPETALEERRVFTPRLLAASHRTEERESAPDLQIESYDLELPAEAAGGAWVLEIESGQPRFVRRFVVSGGTAGGEEVTLAEGSLFRLQDPLRERLAVTLPRLEVAVLRLTLEGEEGFFLEPTLRLVSARVLAESEPLRVPLEVRRSRSLAGRTVVELARPRGLVPDRLAVATATASFNRRFEVFDRGSGGDGGTLGAATLYRLEGAVGERLEVPLATPLGDGLRVVIENGDSPPLEELAFAAVLRRPSLVFPLADPGPGPAAGYLLFGGARAFRPRYDLVGLVVAAGEPGTGEAARLGAVLRDPARLGRARLGPLGPNPRWDPSPALAFAMRPGTRIAVWPFAYRRPLSVPPTDEGLLRLTLDVETVARSRADLADLRLVDAESRQWPYLLDRSAAARRVPLAVRGQESRAGVSSYELALPARPLRLEELLLDGPAPYFDRPFELLAVPEGGGGQRRTLTRGRLSRRPEDPREIAIGIRPRRLLSLELRVEDGDDRPLVWSSVEARVPLAELLFAAPEGEYTLLFGNPDARRPSYELERVRDLILTVDSTPVEAGELDENPGRGPFARMRGEGGWQQILLWAALVLAAVVLGWMTLRLARQEPAAD